MPKKEKATGVQVQTEFAHQFFLGFIVKVNNDITAKNNINRVRKPKVLIHEVETAKADQTPEFWGYSNFRIACILVP